MLNCFKDFENEYKDFKVWNVDFECRLASLLCSALKDCSGLESAFKVSKTDYMMIVMKVFINSQ